MPDAQGRYTLLALGDSVIWGQGLAAGHSFARQVRDWLAHLKPQGATLASLARSGAILEEMTDADFKQRIDRLVYGRMKPTLERLQQAFPASQVIVTDYFPIFTPGSLQGLLSGPVGLAAAPLVAPGRAPREIAAALLWAMHPSLDRRATANRIIEQSALWVTYGTKRLQDAIDEVNGNGPPRFFLARPGFGPDNGALAPDAWLWTFGGGLDDLVRLLLRLLGDLLPPDMAATTSREPLGALRIATSGTAFTVGYALGAGFATDDATAARWLGAFDYYVFSSAGQSDPQATLPSGVETSLASVGHPNPSGAAAYVKAIQAVPIP